VQAVGKDGQKGRTQASGEVLADIAQISRWEGELNYLKRISGRRKENEKKGKGVKIPGGNKGQLQGHQPKLTHL